MSKHLSRSWREDHVKNKKRDRNCKQHMMPWLVLSGIRQSCLQDQNGMCIIIFATAVGSFVVFVPCRRFADGCEIGAGAWSDFSCLLQCGKYLSSCTSSWGSVLETVEDLDLRCRHDGFFSFLSTVPWMSSRIVRRWRWILTRSW